MTAAALAFGYVALAHHMLVGLATLGMGALYKPDTAEHATLDDWCKFVETTLGRDFGVFKVPVCMVGERVIELIIDTRNDCGIHPPSKELLRNVREEVALLEARKIERRRKREASR